MLLVRVWSFWILFLDALGGIRAIFNVGLLIPYHWGRTLLGTLLSVWTDALPIPVWELGTVPSNPFPGFRFFLHTRADQPSVEYPVRTLEGLHGCLCAALTYQVLCSANSNYLGIPALTVASFHLYFLSLCHILETLSRQEARVVVFCVSEDQSLSLLDPCIFKTIASYILFVGFLFLFGFLILFGQESKSSHYYSLLPGSRKP